MRIALATLCLMLAGCATQHPDVAVKFSKVGSGQDVYDRDLYGCLKDTRTTVTSGVIINGTGGVSSREAHSNTMVVACMKSKGYTATDTTGKPLPKSATVVKIIE